MFCCLYCRPPTPIGTWRYCFVRKSHEGQLIFRIYDEETHQYLLGATVINKSLYFTQYYNMPKDMDKTGNYCAVLTQVEPHKFELYTKECELCDDYLQLYSCCSYPTLYRQKLCEIEQYDYHIPQASIDARQMKVTLPKIENNQRFCWCPRTKSVQEISTTISPKTPVRKPISSYSSSSLLSSLSLSSSEMSTPEPLRKAISPTTVKTTNSIVAKTVMPKWNNDINSLVLRFSDDRVRVASAKNFVMSIKDDICLQYGKFCPQKFTMDYKYPFCLLQVAAISLSNYVWK